jgi:plastocyanin
VNRYGLALVLCGALFGSCGSSSSSNLPPGYYISISGMAFSPLDLAAPPGATVTVINDDTMEHSVTSEAAAGDYAPGSVAGVSFDTGVFAGEVSVALPADAPEGTVIPYYCTIHKGAMVTTTGTITIRASAQPQTAPGGSAGGGAGGVGGGGGGGY